MSYLRIKRVNRGSYYYIMRSERRGGRVRSRVLEYLGAHPDPERLSRACDYWGVTTKIGKPKGRAKQ